MPAKLFLAGCDGSDAGQSRPDAGSGAPSCDELFTQEFVPCGEDLVGSWKEVGCSELLAPIESAVGPCAGESRGTSIQTYLVDGFVIFRPEGDFLTSAASHIWDVETMPVECRS